MSLRSLLPTPKNLGELTEHLMLIPLSMFRKQAPEMIQDYLAQRFGAAYLKYDKYPDIVIAIERLYLDVVHPGPSKQEEEP